MTDEEKRQYELARLGIARLMGDASEVDKWAKVVSQTRAGEQRHAPAEASGEYCLCEKPLDDDGWRCVRCGKLLSPRSGG